MILYLRPGKNREHIKKIILNGHLNMPLEITKVHLPEFAKTLDA